MLMQTKNGIVFAVLVISLVFQDTGSSVVWIDCNLQNENCTSAEETTDVTATTVLHPVDSETKDSNNFLDRTSVTVLIVAGACAAFLVTLISVVLTVLCMKKFSRRTAIIRRRSINITPKKAFSHTDSKTYGNLDLPCAIGTPIGPGRVYPCHGTFPGKKDNKQTFGEKAVDD